MRRLLVVTSLVLAACGQPRVQSGSPTPEQWAWCAKNEDRVTEVYDLLFKQQLNGQRDPAANDAADACLGAYQAAH